MIFRNMKSVTVKSFPATQDSYGQVRQGTPTTRTVEMSMVLTSQDKSDDPRFEVDDFIGLTKDTGITTDNEVEIDSVGYLVTKVQNQLRYSVVYLRRKA